MPSYFAKALLFDLDGTLIDSFKPARRVWQEWAKSVNLSADVGPNFGRQRSEVIAALLPHLPPDAIASHAETVRRGELTDTEGVVAFKGAYELLHSLPPESWAIVTSTDRAVAETRLVAAGLPVPKVLVTAEDLDSGKPDPKGYLLAARKLHVRPQEVIVLEDALSGIEAARRAGMRSIAVRTTAASDALLEDATEIIDDLSVLAAAIYMRGLLLHIKQ